MATAAPDRCSAVRPACETLLSESALADNPRRALSSSRWIEENQKRHDKIADLYDGRHPEIYNPTEQRRLRQALSDALAEVRSPNRMSLDFGSGTGNITGKLLVAGREVCAADLSSGMLAALRAQFADAAESGKLRTEVLSGEFPLPFPDGHFGFVASYSVLHHVPDYLEAVRELARVVAPGGVLFIDHELNAEHWRSPFFVRVHRLLTMPRYSFGRVWARLKALFGYKEPPLPPPDQRPVLEEGDIHIYSDDCIDWGAIREITAARGFEELSFRDYLLCVENSRWPIRHMLCRRFATDMGIYVGRKR
jgi:ubiquinone/menaquinone biosynthesis C-methylase UbiE